MKPRFDEVAQEDTGVTGASAAAEDTKRRGANIQASCNFGDGMAVKDDARDDVRAFANLQAHRRRNRPCHGSQAPSSLHGSRFDVTCCDDR